MILSIAAFLTVFSPSDPFPEWRPVRFSRICKEEIFWVEDEPWWTRERPPGASPSRGDGGWGQLGKLSLHRVAETSSEMGLGYQPFHSQVVNFGGDPPWLPQPALLGAGRLRFEMMARLLSVGHRMMILNERRPCTLVCHSLSNGQITGPSDEEMGYFLVDRRPEFFSVVLRQLAKPS